MMFSLDNNGPTSSDVSLASPFLFTTSPTDIVSNSTDMRFRVSITINVLDHRIFGGLSADIDKLFHEIWKNWILLNSSYRFNRIMIVSISFDHNPITISCQGSSALFVFLATSPTFHVAFGLVLIGT